MTSETLRTRLLATTFFCGAMIAAPAWAQTTAPGGTGAAGDPVAQGPDAAGNTDEGELIVVTGSRIAQPELSSATPLTVVGAEEVKLTGTSRVEDLVNNLPQVFAGQGGGVSNGATGIATINLRGLGANRTLVLINGRRLVPGDPRTPVADINFIPAALISRVDVLTGGASATYGSDALGGVVNFIMDTELEGFRLDGQYSFFQHDNDGDQRARDALGARNFSFPDGNTVGGDTYQLDAAIGLTSPDGRGNITVYAGYRSISSVLQSERDFTSCSLTANSATAAVRPGGFSCAGSGTTAPTRFGTNGFLPGDNGAAAQDLIIDVTRPGAGGLRAYSGARDAYNFGPLNYFQRPDERFTLGGFANYEVASFFKPYLEVMFMDNETNAQIAPSGIFLQTQNVNCDNPFLTAEQVAAFCTRFGYGPTDFAPIAIGRRNVEGGGRDADLTHSSFRIVTGVKGEIGRGLNYDIYYQFGRVRLEQIYQRDFSIARTARALDVVLVDGVPTCRSVVDGSDPNCRPYNIFRDAGLQTDPRLGVTAEALNYLQTPGVQIGETREQVVNGAITGNLGEFGFTSPFAENGIGFAIGGEYRDEFLQLRNDAAFQTGDLAGQGGPTVDVAGGFNVAEFFVEASIPLVEDRPFFNELRVNGGYRYSDYNTAGSTDTYKGEVVWSPVSDIVFRGGYNRAVRAPNAVELFTPQAIGLFGGTDPCAGPTPGATLAQCALSGVTAAQYGTIPDNPANQFNQITGGNPDLEPEISDTYTAGVVLKPRFVPGLSVTVDYFSIEVENLISTVGAQLILNQCVFQGATDLCALIQRDRAGSLFLGNEGFVQNVNTNIGGLKTSGIDIQAAYRFDFEDIGVGIGGGLGFDFVGTYLEELSTDTGIIDGGTGELVAYDCQSYYGSGYCGTPNPDWRHQLRVTYTSPGGFSASVRWRYFAPVKDEGNSPDVDIVDNVFPADSRLGARHYLDLSARVAVTDRHSFRVGVNNVLDKDPPLVGSQNLSAVFGNGNTYPVVYDALGRYFFAGFTANF